MTTRELRQKFLDFFASKGHQRFPSGSLIPFDVTGRLDESLLFNGAGMVQFKPFFRGSATPPNPRLTTAQKCVRTGDIEDVGDASHLTFFEMLGNFSFGDYFKVQAIDYSWEFMTSPQWLGLDPKRLVVTVFESDDEAYAAWAKWFESVGLNPEHRIFRLGEDTNYWPAGAFSKGPPGPCGPNSEMFYWVPTDVPAPSGPYTVEDYLRDDKAGLWLEIWNDVFIQYEWQGELKDPEKPHLGYAKTGMPNLPFQSIDTGMGLERTAAVLAGYPSVYETDVFQEILRRIEALSNGRVKYGADEATTRAMRIVADHIRTACFCIADGVLPGNSGRGYVLRRLIRRAVLKGLRTLGFDQPFFHLVFDGVKAAMGDHYHELGERQDVIVATLLSEEELFRRTIRAGSDLLGDALDDLRKAGVTQLSGETAFKLYDTFGFPLEVTRELCAEAGFSVDEEGFDRELKIQQDRSRGADGRENVYGGGGPDFILVIRETTTQPTEFVGYRELEVQTRVLAAVPEVEEGRSTGRFAVALEATPFYAESGGQVSDTGEIIGGGFRLEVLDSIKQDGVFVHLVEPKEMAHPDSLASLSPEDFEQVLHSQVFNHPVVAKVDLARRNRIIRNHTATHLAHAALRTVLGKHVTQAGSLVSPEHLRFDFTHGHALTPDEIEAVEQWVNEATLAGHGVEIHEGVPLDHAKAMGAMALFGEKYGEFVRVVDIRSAAGAPVSVELCGGCHVGSTGQIGMFKIVKESAVGSGVRRIEAVTGLGAREWAVAQQASLRHAAGLLKSNEHDVVGAVERLLETLKEERKKLERLVAQSGTSGDAAVTALGDYSLAVREVDGLEPKEAQAIADGIVNNDTKRVALVVVKGDGKVTFIAKAGKDAVSAGVHCGNLVKELAARTGGGGGGRPDFATAGGRDLSRLGDALDALESLVRSMLP